MVVAATSTEGVKKREVAVAGQRDTGALVQFSTSGVSSLLHFLAVPILSPEGIASLLLEIQEGGEVGSTSCRRDRRSLLDTQLSTRFMKPGTDNLCSYWSLLLPWDLNGQNWAAGSSYASLDPNAVYYVTSDVFQPQQHFFFSPEQLSSARILTIICIQDVAKNSYLYNYLPYVLSLQVFMKSLFSV